MLQNIPHLRCIQYHFNHFSDELIVKDCEFLVVIQFDEILTDFYLFVMSGT